MRPYILAETSWKTISTENYSIAVLPWGATEAHNYHLPYATDNYEADAIAAESCRIAYEKGAKAIVLPCIPYGVNTGQFDVKLDMNLNPSTQLAILSDIIETLNRQGIYKLIILNSHGGNDFRQILRELGLKFPKMFLSEINWYKIKDAADIFDDLGEHAGEVETSLMLHLYPEFVLPISEAGEGKAKKFRFKGISEGWAWAERRWTSVTSDTGIGNPKTATAEKGKLFFDLMCKKIGNYLYEIATTEKDDFYVD